MSDKKPVSNAVTGIGVTLAILSALATFVAVGVHADLNGGDAAGTAMVRGFAALWLIVLYAALAGLALTAAVGGATSPLGKLLLLALVPLGLLMSMSASGLLEDTRGSPGHWPLLVIAGFPIVIIALCLWATMGLRRFIPDPVALALACGLAVLLCLAFAPMRMARDAVLKREADRETAVRARFAALPPDAPLWTWLPFVQSDVYEVSEAAAARIRELPRRQRDAEDMLDRDQLSFSLLSAYDFDPTPSLCEKARGSLARRAAALAARQSSGASAETIGSEVQRATEGMRWLVGLDCSCDAESKAWEDLARASGVSEYSLKTLADLRDPRELGERLLNDPPRFSMLSSRSRLHAWVGFAVASGASKEQVRAALDGARKLDHRTSDAVTWLTDPRYASDRYELMSVFPRLDLEATPALCAAGLAYVRPVLAQIYRPKADEPRSFDQLEFAFGIDQPLTNLLWLASKGCEADAALDEAEALVRAYGDTPSRELMLARIAALRRKP